MLVQTLHKELTVSVQRARGLLRFYGSITSIDAPENDQTCRQADGQSYPCGFQAANALGFMTAYPMVRWLLGRGVTTPVESE